MPLSNLRQLKIHNANESSFGVAEGSFSGRDIRCATEPVCHPDQEAIDDPSIRQRAELESPPILGLKSKTKLTFNTFLRGTGTAAASTVAALGAADLAEGQLLKNAFSQGESLGTGTTINGAGATTTVLPCTSAAGLAIGQAVLVSGEATPIGNIAANDVTLIRALSGAPAAATVVNASATYYPNYGAVNTGSLQFQLRGSEDDYHNLLGCQATCKLANLNPGQIPQISWECMVASWTAGTSAAMIRDSWDNATDPPTIGSAGALYIQTVATTTINEVDASALSIDLGLVYETLRSPGGIQGIQGYELKELIPKFEITINSWSDTWRDVFEAGTAKYIHYQIGSTAGNTILIEMQNCYFDKWERVGVNGITGTKITGKAFGLGSTLTTLRRAPLRIHLL